MNGAVPDGKDLFEPGAMAGRQRLQEPEVQPETVMSDANQGARLLDDGELDAVSGGIRDEEDFLIKDEVNFIGDEENFIKPGVAKPTLAGLITRTT